MSRGCSRRGLLLALCIGVQLAAGGSAWSSVSDRNIKALQEGCRAKGHQVVIGGELFSDAMGKDGTPEGTYVGMVRHNVDTIVHALK